MINLYLVPHQGGELYRGILIYHGQYFPYYHTLARSVIAHIFIGLSVPAYGRLCYQLIHSACGLNIRAILLYHKCIFYKIKRYYKIKKNKIIYVIFFYQSRVRICIIDGQWSHNRLKCLIQFRLFIDYFSALQI